MIRKSLLSIGLALLLGTIITPPALAATDLFVEPISPHSGSSQPDQAFTIKTRHGHMQGSGRITEMMIWIDNQTPSTRRSYSGIHAKVVRSGTTFKLYGHRYNGGLQTCGLDTEPRHCFQNYVWDVGGFTVSPSSAFVYSNYQDAIADTTSATPNTIGRIRAKSVTQHPGNVLEVEWEIVLGKYFSNKSLEIHASAADDTGNNIYTQNRPSWHEVGMWRLENTSPTTSFYENFENATDFSDWPIVTNGGSAVISGEHSYTGRYSALLTGVTGIEKDLGSAQSGVVSMYFWDDMSPTNSIAVAVSDQPTSQNDLSSTNKMIVGIIPEVSTEYYSYKARLEAIDSGANINDLGTQRWYVTPVRRSLGWHKVQFWITETGGWAEISDPLQEISLYNLSSLTSAYLTNENRARFPFDWEFNNFKYLQITGRSSQAALWVDNIRVTSLPALPTSTQDLTSYNSALKWSDFFMGTYLDTYGEQVRYGNLERMTQTICQNYQGDPCNSWWFNGLTYMAVALATRYEATQLPYYRDKFVYLWDFMLQNGWSGYEWANGGVGPNTVGGRYLSAVTYGWNIMSPNQRAETYSQLMRLLSENLTTRAQVDTIGQNIGDSHGENYAYGHLQSAARSAIFFNDHPYAERFMGFAREMAIKALAHDPNENCPTCPGGKVGIKNIYAPGENPQDCANISDPARSQACLCRGDRAALPGNHDFSYLFDNHDYHPHPDYWPGVIQSVPVGASLTRAYNSQFGTNLPIYPEFSHNVLPSWRRYREFFDFRKIRFEASKIYRIRDKWTCDGSASLVADRGPYNQATDNHFRILGTDDWGVAPSVKLNLMLNMREALGQAETTFQGYDLLDRAAKDLFWKHSDYMGVPAIPHQQIPNADLGCVYDPLTGFCPLAPTNKLYIQDRLNNPTFAFFSSLTINPDFSYPLKVCEENIFKKHVWSGTDFAWDCPSDIKKSGNQSLKISSTTNTNSELFSPLISVDPNSNYRITYWVKTESVVRSTANITARIIPGQFKQAANEATAIDAQLTNNGFSYGTNISGTHDWQQVSYTFRTAADASYVRLRAILGGDGLARGTVYFDEVNLEKLGTIPGDLTGDGQVNMDDITKAINDFATSVLGIFGYNQVVANFGR